MRITREEAIVNNRNCFRYHMTVPKDSVIIEKGGRYDRIPDEEEEKFLNMIRKEIKDNEAEIDTYCFIDERNETVEFEVCSKNKEDLKLEREILNALNNEMDLGLKEEYNDVDVSGKWARINARFSYTKRNMNRVAEIINATDYEVIFDSFMGDCFMLYKIR